MLKSFVGPFVATFFISMFVLIMQFFWRMIDEIVGKGLDFSVIAELVLYLSITLVPMALPLAVLLASIMTFGNLGEHYELIALKAAGISLYRIMKPLIVLIIFLTGFALFFSNNMLPVANLKLYSLLYDIRRQKPEMSFKEGIFTNDLEGYSIKIDRINKKTGMMYNMLIYNHKDGNGNFEVTKADSGMMISDVQSNLMELVLFHGQTYTDEGMKNASARKTFPFRRLKFDKETVLIELPGTDLKRTDENSFRSASRMLNLKQLNYTIDSIQNYLDIKKAGDTKRYLATNYRRSKNTNVQQDSILTEKSRGMFSDADSLFRSFDPEEQKRALDNALQYARDVKQRSQEDQYYYVAQQENIIKNQLELHRKFTLSFACFIFFFIGAPLGAIIRKGGLGMPVVVSILLFIIYYIISMMGERSAREAVISPFMGMWISAIILLPLGIILTYKSVTDSEMMNTDAYKMFFEKLMKVFHLKRRVMEQEVKLANKGGEKMTDIFDKMANGIKRIFKRK